MSRTIYKLSLAAITLATAATLASPAANAQASYTIQGGRTSVVLSAGFVSALESLDVTPGVVTPTALADGTVNFPVTGGVIDVDRAFTQITHSGGLTLTAGKTVVTLENFIIDTTGKWPVITGLVTADGSLVGRLPLFDLTLPKGITLPLKPSAGTLDLAGVGVSLDANGAAALNSVFKIKALKGGIAIGTATVDLFLPFVSDEK